MHLRFAPSFLPLPLLVALASAEVGSGAPAHERTGSLVPRGSAPVVSLSGTPQLRSLAEMSRTGLPATVSDSENCEDPTCATQANVSDTFSVNGFSGSVDCSGNGSSDIALDAGGGALLVVTAEGSAEATANASADSESLGGVVDARCLVVYRASFETTVPLQLDVSPSVGAYGSFGSADVRVVDPVLGTVLVEGSVEGAGGSSNPPSGFSGVVPPGVVSIELSANASGEVFCEPPFCSEPLDASGSFSFTLTFLERTAGGALGERGGRQLGRSVELGPGAGARRG
jgi:hypothetical protein